MTDEAKQAIDILQKEILCVSGDCDTSRCHECDLVMPDSELIIKACKVAIKALEQEPKADSWSIKDVADTFKKHGLIREQETSGDLISRQAVIDIIHRFFTEEVDKIPTKKTEDGEVIIICKAQPLFAMNKTLSRRIKELPSVNPQEKTGHCKACKYFEYDSVAKVDGIPLIVAHEICSRWGDGCKTSEDGYCFLFEPQESEG